MSILTSPDQAHGENDTKIVPLINKEFTDIAGKEGTMLTIEYAPGASTPKHRHDAHVRRSEGYSYGVEKCQQNKVRQVRRIDGEEQGSSPGTSCQLGLLSSYAFSLSRRSAMKWASRWQAPQFQTAERPSDLP